VSAQEARVVIGQLLLHRGDRLDPALLDQLRQQLGVVDHLEVPARLRVLHGDGVEAVRAGRYDRRWRGLLQRLDVPGGEHRVHELVADPPSRVLGARLGGAEYREPDPGGSWSTTSGAGADHPFADHVRSGYLRQGGENPDAVRSERGGDGTGELARPVLTKLLFDEASGRVIGVGIVGPAPGNSSLAMEMGADAANLALTSHSHPTLSETVGLAAEAFEGTITDLHLPKKK
jgi:Pyridine nucleotide-disulphide oxidoreductase, dimerisation domain